MKVSAGKFIQELKKFFNEERVWIRSAQGNLKKIFAPGHVRDAQKIVEEYSIAVNKIYSGLRELEKAKNTLDEKHLSIMVDKGDTQALLDYKRLYFDHEIHLGNLFGFTIKGK